MTTILESRPLLTNNDLLYSETFLSSTTIILE